MKGRAAIRKVAPDFVTGLLLLLTTHCFGIDSHIQKSTYGTYRIDTSLGEMLFDTGSSTVVLTSETQKKIKIHRKNIANVRLANEKTAIVEKYTIRSMNINGCNILNIKAVTFPTGKTNILGMSVIEKISPITINTKTSTIHFKCNNQILSLRCRGCFRY